MTFIAMMNKNTYIYNHEYVEKFCRLSNLWIYQAAAKPKIKTFLLSNLNEFFKDQL